VVAAYVRAIETKDLTLFRSIKPNMSAEEQRRIEEGFQGSTVLTWGPRLPSPFARRAIRLGPFAA
jgi:hypothetical protein